MPAGGSFKLMNPKNFYGAPVYQGTTDANRCASVPTPAVFNVYAVTVSANAAPVVTMPANITTSMPGHRGLGP